MFTKKYSLQLIVQSKNNSLKGNELKNTELTTSKINSNSDDFITVDQIIINENEKEKNTPQMKVPKLDLSPITNKNIIVKTILAQPNNNSTIVNQNIPIQSNKIIKIESPNNKSKRNLENIEDAKSSNIKDQNDSKILDSKILDNKILDHKIPITYAKPRLSVINSIGIRVGPEIFVTIKKGSIFDNYKIGKTLGEGNN